MMHGLISLATIGDFLHVCDANRMQIIILGRVFQLLELGGQCSG